MITLLSDPGATAIAGRADGENLWLPAGDVERATGWALKPEGFCKGDGRVPVPRGLGGEFIDGDRSNVAALWNHMDLPVAHDAAGETWVLAESAASRSAQLQSLEAPDFSLPDL